MVSPDGCKIVFVHALHSQAEADSAKALREGKSGTRTLKTIDLCKGEKTGEGPKVGAYERMVA